MSCSRSLRVFRSDDWDVVRFRVAMSERDTHTGGYNDHNEQDDDADNDANAHLHVFPPHLLSNFVGTSAETSGRGSQIIGLVLNVIDMFTTLRNFIDVVFHYANRVIDLLLTTQVSNSRRRATSTRVQRTKHQSSCSEACHNSVDSSLCRSRPDHEKRCLSRSAA